VNPSPSDLQSLSLFADLDPSSLEELSSCFEVEQREATSSVTVWSMFGTRFREFERDFRELAERIRTTYA
jgi:hypothetical protein